MFPIPTPTTPVIENRFFTLPFLRWFKSISDFLMKMFTSNIDNKIYLVRLGSLQYIQYIGPSNTTISLPTKPINNTSLTVYHNNTSSVIVMEKGLSTITIPDLGESVEITGMYITGDNL